MDRCLQQAKGRESEFISCKIFKILDVINAATNENENIFGTENGEGPKYAQAADIDYDEIFVWLTSKYGPTDRKGTCTRAYLDLSQMPHEDMKAYVSRRMLKSAELDRLEIKAILPGQPTLKTSRKEFFVPLPNDEASLRNRFEVMGACLMMLKMRFLNNYALSTVTPELMREYADYLCGERVWGYVVKDESGLPVSCPSLARVLGYEQSMRDLAWKLVKSSNYTFKAGLEAAMADADTRILNFTTGFSMEANSAACRKLSAPGLQEIYANLPRQVSNKLI